MKILIVCMTVFLSGCFLPVDGSSIADDEIYTLYTPNPSQRVRMLCASYLWPLGNAINPLSDEDYFLKWKVMETGRTSSTATVGNSYPVYRAFMEPTLTDFDIVPSGSSGEYKGCYDSISWREIRIKPQIKHNGTWVDWYVVDQDGWDCILDNDQHNDDPADPNWPARGYDCQSGSQNMYSTQ